MNEVKETKAETTEIQKREDKTPIMAGNRGLQLSNMEEIWRFANYVSKSGLAPKGFETPEACFIVIEFGMELGLSPMMSLQNIANINGRPCIWGDALPGLVRASGLMESYKETELGTPFNDDYGFEVETRRKGDMLPVKRRFTVGEAKKAGLWGKAGPWSQYPARMLLMRPRSWALRDAYPDVMKGLSTSEELRDMRDVEVEVVPGLMIAEVEHVNTDTGEITMTAKKEEPKAQHTFKDSPTNVPEKEYSLPKQPEADENTPVNMFNGFNE